MDRNIRLEIESSDPRPVVSMRLEQMGETFVLALRHSDKGNYQRLFHFTLHDGKIQVAMQGIFADELCEALGIGRGATPPIKLWGYDVVLLETQSRETIKAKTDG